MKTSHGPADILNEPRIIRCSSRTVPSAAALRRLSACLYGLECAGSWEKIFWRLPGQLWSTPNCRSVPVVLRQLLDTPDDVPSLLLFGIKEEHALLEVW